MLHSWQNVVNANGVTISLMGMAIVFSSLALITTIISWTPVLLKLVNRVFPEAEIKQGENGVKKVSETDVVAAISAVLCHTAQSTNKQM